MANTGVVFDPQWRQSLGEANSLGIIAGLVLGKPVGIVLLSYLAVTTGLCRLPADLSWRHLIGLGLLAGIGFTMSIFIANLAFTGQPEIINASKMAILVASVSAGLLGMLWLTLVVPRTERLSC
ncbi:MAG: Na+/H+ antiporter NhaA [Comamonadaceae bacterium]